MKNSSICEICRFNFIMLIAVEGKLFKYLLEYTSSRVFFKLKLQEVGQRLYQKETQTQMFSCEFCEILRKRILIEYRSEVATRGFL